MGLKNHSEIGWVLREYNSLVENARRLGIKSPESQYNDGKIKGKVSRNKSIEGQRSPEKAAAEKVAVPESWIYPCDVAGESEPLHMQGKPTLAEFPKLIKQPRTTEVPKLLEGFKPIRRK